ncbi:MAG: transcriptional repressor [Bacteroidales bacterium]|jgi:Fur family ferric uptake transcriptional regulator|nr:transcriptional repressor [Bacteroidales bacterium]HUM33556.1 transcriptional repressor [Bacteroidales bacterium]
MKAVEVLNHHHLKRTSCREGIIEVVMNAKQALSENEIRERLSGKYDRTTFYRSFKTLEEHKIIHKIVVDNQLVKYALDNSVTHKDEHVHFYCIKCNSVKCMDNIPIKKYQLPHGYSEIGIEVLIKGICENCKK